MFNLQSLVAMASRAEFDNLVSQFNSTPADQKMAQLQNANPEAFQKFLGGMLNK